MIGGVVAAGAFLLPATAAHAALGGCISDIVGDKTGTAYCSFVNNGSHFRAKVTCVKYSTGQTRVIVGPFRYSSIQSAATCLTTEYAGDAIVDPVN
jgi:hypothetical protein